MCPSLRSIASMSTHINSGSLAPYCDDVALAITTGWISIASKAAATEMLKPGNEPDQPTATTSPGSTPACCSMSTTTAAKLGFTDVCFDCRLAGRLVVNDIALPTMPL